jgi:hypothetical protein
MAEYTCGIQGGQDVTTCGRGYRDAVRYVDWSPILVSGRKIQRWSSCASQEVSPPRKNVYVPSDTHCKTAGPRRRDEQYDPRVVEECRVADIPSRSNLVSSFVCLRITHTSSSSLAPPWR